MKKKIKWLLTITVPVLCLIFPLSSNAGLVSNLVETPEPVTMLLVGSGLIGIGVCLRRTRQGNQT